MIKFAIIYCFLLIGCATTNAKKKSISNKKTTMDLYKGDEMDLGVLDELQKKRCSGNIKSLTTTFYEVYVFPKLIKNKLNLLEHKILKLEISNWGCKDIFVPQYLTRNNGHKDELFIEIYKESQKGVFELYESNIIVNSQENDSNRKVYALKDGIVHSFGDLVLDKLNPINEIGKYYVKVYIDLSSFGYFKKIESTSLIFDVLE